MHAKWIKMNPTWTQNESKMNINEHKMNINEHKMNTKWIEDVYSDDEYSLTELVMQF